MSTISEISVEAGNHSPATETYSTDCLKSLHGGESINLQSSIS